MKLNKRTGWIIAAVVGVLLIVLVAMDPTLIVPLLITLLVVGLIYLGIEGFRRIKKKQKQRDFDEKVAAKEGIEDRKREWSGWMEQLEQQGIDRYELPFYLLVGEPQSGKSVLLQNSDLYFPFGQDRLSGVGGTRGCDWWFTDEAVVLDIAGRLFTHEGGASDKFEWEAFLQLLYEFRPLCPANGVILVIPCDSLNQDSPDVCAEKANKIQTALLTLTQKLQAKMPVYLVLTKGDRVFGFAESVHRLEAEDRHQMFGWSAEADTVEQPFRLETVRDGFQELVGRARGLRDRMVATARIPEALPEIDRLYAFPDEFAALYPALETYLKRIFTESGLVERTSFRGIYLTSGLQSGVPIAKVCGDLLGDAREADGRALESLFSHQRAYFIKDLVRGRVFRERGLVRPTEGRVTRARRNAALGYGVSAVVAGIALLGSLFYVAQGRTDEQESVLRTALKSTEEIAHRPPEADTVKDLMAALYRIKRGATEERATLEQIYQNSVEKFQTLYSTVYDECLTAALRRELQAYVAGRLADDAKEPPASFADVRLLLEATELLVSEVDFTKRDVLEMIRPLLGGALDVQKDGRPIFTIEEAAEYRDSLPGRYESSPPGKPTASMTALIDRMERLLNDSLRADHETPFDHKLQVDGTLGFFVDVYEADKLRQELGRPDLSEVDSILEKAANYVRLVGKLREQERATLKNSAFRTEMIQLQIVRVKLIAYRDNTPRDQPIEWTKLEQVTQKAADEFARNEDAGDVREFNRFTPGGVSGGFIDRLIEQKAGSLKAEFRAVEFPPFRDALADRDTFEACEKHPTPSWRLPDLELRLQTGRVQGSTLATAKVYAALGAFEKRFKDWKALAAELGLEVEANKFNTTFVDRTRKIRSRLGELQFKPAEIARQRIAHLDTLLLSYLQELQGGLAPSSEVDWDVIDGLGGLLRDDQPRDPLSRQASTMQWSYLRDCQGKLLESWQNQVPETTPPDDEGYAEALIGSIADHFMQLNSRVQSKQLREGDSSFQIWRELVDDLLADVLKRSTAMLQSYWTPDTKGWSNAETAAKGIEAALSDSRLRDKLDDEQDQPCLPQGCEAVRNLESLVETGAFDKSKAALRDLDRAYGPDQVNDVRDGPAKQLEKIVAGYTYDPRNPGRGAEAAQAIEDIVRLMGAGESEGFGRRYVRRLIQPSGEYQGIAKLLETECRTTYLAGIREIIGRETELYRAVYSPSGNASDSNLRTELNRVFGVDGTLQKLRRTHGMEPGAKPALRPEAPFDDVPDAGWWAVEEFLFGLDSALIGAAKGKPGNRTFTIEIEPHRKRNSAWGRTSEYNHVYLPSSDATKDAVEKLFDAESLGDLEWSLADDEPELWMQWSSKSYPAFRKSRDLGAPGDALYKSDGIFLPFRLAWQTDSENAQTWNVELTMQNSSGAAFTAPLKFRFKGLELPRRPQYPSGGN